MLDPNLKDIIAKAYAKLGDISYSIALNMKKGKDSSISQRKLYEQGIKMRMILRVLLRQITFDSITNFPTLYRLTEEQVNKFVRCLIQLGELNKYPTVPVLVPNTQPVIVASLQGDTGPPGPIGPQGLTGLATDFSLVGANTIEIVDSFLITAAKAARWDYFVISNTGKQRASTILGHWLADGSAYELSDEGSEDIGGDTEGLIEFDINITGGYVQLIANITSETWTIVGSRYFIPNNGTGTGIINGVLAHNNIYIGNSLDQAQARLISGVISINDIGIVTFTDESIVDAAINTTANITLSKLASLNPNIVTITDGSGKLISSTLSPTTLGYVDISSSLTALLGAKLTDPLTTIGDLLIKDASNNTTRLGIGAINQILGIVAGVPTWINNTAGISGLTTSFLPKASSSTTLDDSIISETTGAILIAGTLEAQGGIKEENGTFTKKKVIPIVNWNMFSSTSKIVAHGLSDITKIISTKIMILNDSGSSNTPLERFDDSTNLVQGGIKNLDSTNITMFIKVGGLYVSGSYSGSGNRGYIDIEYEV